MNRLLKFRMIWLVLAVALLPAWPVYASGQPDSLGAVAQFRSHQNLVRPGDPCVSTIVTITAQKDFAGGQPPTTQIILDIVEFDDCVVDDFGLVAEWYSVTTLGPADEALTISPNLGQARLRGTITACNLVDDTDCRTLKLDVQWRGQGEPESGVGFTLRDALAWGRVFDATHRLNLAPDRAVFAQLSRFDAP